MGAKITTPVCGELWDFLQRFHLGQGSYFPLRLGPDAGLLASIMRNGNQADIFVAYASAADKNSETRLLASEKDIASAMAFVLRLDSDVVFQPPRRLFDKVGIVISLIPEFGYTMLFMNGATGLIHLSQIERAGLEREQLLGAVVSARVSDMETIGGYCRCNLKYPLQVLSLPPLPPTT